MLQAPENLTRKERLRLSNAYLLKEELRALYWCSPRRAPDHHDGWLRWASRSKLKPFVKLARTVRDHRWL